MQRKIRVGTRESALAIVQTNQVLTGIKAKFPWLEFEPVGITTSGDLVLDKTLNQIGGKGLFVKELELALLNGVIDLAVHSMKDIPAQTNAGLIIAAVTQREDPRDALITANGTNLTELPAGAVVGTGSPRREVQLLQKRPDLKVAALRGNVLTRIDKLMGRQYDAIVVAAAGLKRLGLEKKAVQYFEVDDIIPAVGQGILAIQMRAGEAAGYLLESIHCPETAWCARAERAYLVKLGGGCGTPVAAHAVIAGATMTIHGMMAAQDRRTVYRASVTGDKQSAATLGEQLADLLLSKTGGDHD